MIDRKRLVMVEMGHPTVGGVTVVFNFNQSNLTSDEIEQVATAINKAACQSFHEIIRDRTLRRAEAIIAEVSIPDPSVKERS